MHTKVEEYRSCNHGPSSPGLTTSRWRRIWRQAMSWDMEAWLTTKRPKKIPNSQKSCSPVANAYPTPASIDLRYLTLWATASAFLWRSSLCRTVGSNNDAGLQDSESQITMDTIHAQLGHILMAVGMFFESNREDFLPPGCIGKQFSLENGPTTQARWNRTCCVRPERLFPRLLQQLEPDKCVRPDSLTPQDGTWLRTNRYLRPCSTAGAKQVLCMSLLQHIVHVHTYLYICIYIVSIIYIWKRL